MRRRKAPLSSRVPNTAPLARCKSVSVNFFEGRCRAAEHDIAGTAKQMNEKCLSEPEMLRVDSGGLHRFSIRQASQMMNETGCLFIDRCVLFVGAASLP